MNWLGLLESVNLRKNCSKPHERLLLWPKLPTYFYDAKTIENNRQVCVNIDAIFHICQMVCPSATSCETYNWRIPKVIKFKLGTLIHVNMQMICITWKVKIGQVYFGLLPVVGGISVSIYSYFMATRETVKLLSRGCGENLGNCFQRPKDEGNSFPDLLHYRGTMVWLFPK